MPFHSLVSKSVLHIPGMSFIKWKSAWSLILLCTVLRMRSGSLIESYMVLLGSDLPSFSSLYLLTAPSLPSFFYGPHPTLYTAILGLGSVMIKWAAHVFCLHLCPHPTPSFLLWTLFQQLPPLTCSLNLFSLDWVIPSAFGYVVIFLHLKKIFLDSMFHANCDFLSLLLCASFSLLPFSCPYVSIKIVFR